MGIFNIDENINDEVWFGKTHELWGCTDPERKGYMWKNDWDLNFDFNKLNEKWNEISFEKRNSIGYTEYTRIVLIGEEIITLRFIILLCFLSSTETEISNILNECLAQSRQKEGGRVDVCVTYEAGHEDFLKIDIDVKTKYPQHMDMVFKRR